MVARVPSRVCFSVDIPPEVLAQVRRHGRRGGGAHAGLVTPGARTDAARRASRAGWIGRRYGARVVRERPGTLRRASTIEVDRSESRTERPYAASDGRYRIERRLGEAAMVSVDLGGHLPGGSFR